jgi:hypothetical protein
MRFLSVLCMIVLLMFIVMFVAAHDARCAVQTSVRISPETIRLGHDGTIMAVVEFPVGYNLREWKVESIECQGASALPGSGVKDKSRVIARFRQIDMKNLVIGDAVPLTVAITAQRRGVAEVFSGADAVKIESYKSPAIACADMAGLTIQDKAFHKPLVISSATPVPAVVDPVTTKVTMPEYCKVVGAVGNDGFQLWLPTSTWNGRMNFEGGGGNCGFIPMAPYPPRQPAGIDLLKLGYAVAGTNAGHDQGPTGPSDASWGYDAKYSDAYEREIDYGYRAVHVTTVAAKLLTRSFFNTPAKYNYFRGCSTGGRQGLMEAQRYPEDFDGIIAGDPPLGFTGLSVIFQGWPEWVDFTSPTERILIGSKGPLIAKAVMDACDGLDNVIDGVINDPRVCTWDPFTSTPSIICSETPVDPAKCLTIAEANVVRKIYDAPRDTKENIIYPGGRPRGSESDWSKIVGGYPDLKGIITSGMQGMVLPNLQYIMFQPDPGPTYKFFDFPCTPNGCDRDVVAKLALYAPLYNATSPHLERFKHRKGKMIMYGGWSTAQSHPYALVDYYERVRKEMGRDTKDFFRLFMIPGMGHCGASYGGPGNANFSQMFPQLVDWVERGIAPREVATTAFTAQSETRTRLLCPYPKVAKYKGGTFDSKVAESYTCVSPDYPVPQNEWDHIKLFPWDAPLDFSWWHGRK